MTDAGVAAAVSDDDAFLPIALSLSLPLSCHAWCGQFLLLSRISLSFFFSCGFFSKTHLWTQLSLFLLLHSLPPLFAWKLSTFKLPKNQKKSASKWNCHKKIVLYKKDSEKKGREGGKKCYWNNDSCLTNTLMMWRACLCSNTQKQHHNPTK